MEAWWAQGSLAGRVRARTPFWDVFQSAESCKADEMSGLRLQGSLQRHRGPSKAPIPCKVPKPVSLGEGRAWEDEV